MDRLSCLDYYFSDAFQVSHYTPLLFHRDIHLIIYLLHPNKYNCKVESPPYRAVVSIEQSQLFKFSQITKFSIQHHTPMTSQLRLVLCCKINSSQIEMNQSINHQSHCHGLRSIQLYPIRPWLVNGAVIPAMNK